MQYQFPYLSRKLHSQSLQKKGHEKLNNISHHNHHEVALGGIYPFIPYNLTFRELPLHKVEKSVWKCTDIVCKNCAFLKGLEIWKNFIRRVGSLDSSEEKIKLCSGVHIGNRKRVVKELDCQEVEEIQVHDNASIVFIIFQPLWLANP